MLHGDNYDAAYAQARRLGRARGLSFIHPYDDPEVIAGQGTIGFEILKQHGGPLDAVFVPVGGGGLIAGIATYIKQLRPQIKIIGVEPEDADAMERSLRANRRVRLDHVGIFADGVAVRQVGAETFRLCKRFVDEIVIVSNDEICAAIKDIFEDSRSILEPAGALAYAGLKRYVEKKRLTDKNLIAIAARTSTSTACATWPSAPRSAARGGARRHHPRAPRALALLHHPGDHNITEFNYRYADPRRAHIFVGLRIHDVAEIKLSAALRAATTPRRHD